MEGILEGAALTVAFGRVLRQQRKQAQLTQEQLGLIAELQRNFVSELERGEKQASVLTLFKLASALHIAPCDFVQQVSSEVERMASSSPTKQRH